MRWSQNKYLRRLPSKKKNYILFLQEGPGFEEETSCVEETFSNMSVEVGAVEEEGSTDGEDEEEQDTEEYEEEDDEDDVVYLVS